MMKNNCLGLIAILFGVALVSPSEVAAGPVKMQFEAIKDVGIYGLKGMGPIPQSSCKAGAMPERFEPSNPTNK